MDSHLQRDSQLLASKIILIDGFSSSGKSLVCPLITALNKVENWQIDYSYEQIAILYYQDKISINSVRAIYNTRTEALCFLLFLLLEFQYFLLVDLHQHQSWCISP